MSIPSNVPDRPVRVLTRTAGHQFGQILSQAGVAALAQAGRVLLFQACYRL